MTRVYKCRAFELSDGSVMTAREIVEEYGVPLGTTRNRLSNGVRDIEVLKQPPLAHKQNKYRNSVSKPYVPEETVKERVAKRNYFCPMSRLVLKMK